MSKNKPQRHKESNVFRFKSFADRISQIDLRHTALYHIPHANAANGPGAADSEQAGETHFRQAFQKWSIENLSPEYVAFQRHIRDIVTLPQLLHRREFVVARLLAALETATTLSLQPLLEFVVALAKDLREHFYAHFGAFLERLIGLLRTQDADQLEWTFVCLAFLVKTLKPFIKKDVSVVFNALLPLLDRRQPEHVTSFAAECFAFVARDIRDRERFLALVLGALRAHTNGVKGCGRLLYEIMRGVNGQLHSCGADLLRVLFRALRGCGAAGIVFDAALLHEVLTEMVLSLLHGTDVGAMPVFWDAVHEVLQEVLTATGPKVGKEEEKDEMLAVTVRRLLELMGQGVEFKHGKMVPAGNAERLIGALCGVLDTMSEAMETDDDDGDNEDASHTTTEWEDTLLCASELVAACLLCRNLCVAQLDASRICRKVLAVGRPAVFEAFVWNVRAYAQFEVLVWPDFVRYYEQRQQQQPDVQQLLCRIVGEKVPARRDGLTAGWQPYALRFRQTGTLAALEASIEGSADDGAVDESAAMERLMMALQLWPHVIGADVDKMREAVLAQIERTCAGFREASADDHTKHRRLLFVLHGLIEAVVHVQRTAWLPVNAILDVLLPVCNHRSTQLGALGTLDLLVTAATATDSTEHINYALFERLHGTISANLASEYKRVRLLTIHILQPFGRLAELCQTDADQPTIYDIFLAVERHTADVTTYKAQLLDLSKLSAEGRLFEAIRGTVCAADALRFLFGALYVNFQLMWKPLIELIATYAQQMPVAEFWAAFRGQLDAVIGRIRGTSGQGAVLEPSDGLETFNQWLMDGFCATWELNDRPDYVNYRVLLWRTLGECGTLSEVRNRDVVQLLLDFVEKEYRRSHENDTLRWNLLKATEADGTEADGAEVDEESRDSVTSPNASLHKGTQKTLIAIVSVFTRLANPSQIYRHADVYALFLELLCHRNAAIQKLALDCIAAHRHKYVQPYKDHLYGLIDETKFRTAIAEFRIDAVVQPEHRPELMTIVVRILYSKMTAKAQKGGGQARKATIMQFLGTCSEAEVMQLLRMAFAVYEPWLLESAAEQVTGIWRGLELQAVLSPKKLQSTLTLIEIMREQFGGLMGAGLLRYLLQMLCAVAAVVEGVLRAAETTEDGDAIVHGTHVKLFKQLRTLGLQAIANFFNHLDAYAWSADEIDTVFRLFVQPQLSRLPAEGIHSATPLLKLLAVFAANPRYFVLLTRLPPAAIDGADETPLRYCVDLLLEPKTKPLVCLAVMEMIEKLLTLADPEPVADETRTAPMPPGHCLAVVRPAELADINFGSACLLPYMKSILLKFQQNATKRRGLTRRDLRIVALCTRLVADAETSEQLLAVLLPILVRKSTNTASGEEELEQAVGTIQNLFERIERPVRHVRSVAPMFAQITAVGPRKQLCDLLDTIARRHRSAAGDAAAEDVVRLQRTAEIVRSLNAWDRRWVQQPDYEKRLGAYERIATLQSAGELDIDLCLLTVYHSFYFLRHDKDLALRDTASQHMRRMLPAMLRQLQSAGDTAGLNYLLGDVVLNLLRRCISDSTDAVRTEGVQLLGVLARECPTAHAVLQDLHGFTDANDPEIDFFENMVHLQAHRHGRGLTRFCEVARRLERLPQPRTLTQFVLPLATRYVCSEQHAERHNLVTSAIEAIGVVAGLLPWHQYEVLLKYYLKKMRYGVEHRKQLVRLVMTVLDAFHFDLSRAQLAKEEVREQLDRAAAKEKEAEAAKLKRVEEGADGGDGKSAADGEEEVVVSASADDELEEAFAGPADAELEELEEEEEEAEVPAGQPAAKRVRQAVLDRSIVLSERAAKRLVHTIATGLIPQLNNAITTISTFDTFHKLNKKKRRFEREEEEILRVPIALAMVKLLQKLPDGMLEHSLPGILLKVCQFLKSPVPSVRNCARDILKAVMLAAGPQHLDTLLQQMTSLLTRGFHVHVLTVTVHAVLDALKLQLRPGDIDRNLQSLLAVIVEDIFGRTAEEKAIHKIGMSTPEAKPSNKSYLTLHIAAINIGASCLLDLLIPFRDQLQRTHSKSTVGKVQDCCQQIVQGLVLNRRLGLETLLTFVYGVISESIPDLLPNVAPPAPLTEAERDKLHRTRPDIFLIAPEPRGRASGTVRRLTAPNVRANAHVLVEFGLDTLHILLKRGKLLKIDYAPFLEPVVPVLVDALRSAHIRVTTFALKCLTALWTHGLELQAMRAAVPESIVPLLFGILHKYSTTGAVGSANNENLQLVQGGFKAMVALLNGCAEYFTVSEEQLRTLLLYVEQHLHDNARQRIAFALLTVIIGRRLLVAEMHDVMRKIAEIVVTSDTPESRKAAKSLMVNYLMEYPIGAKKVDGFVKFFIVNLSYEVAAGRESVIAVLHTIVKRFPREVLNAGASVNVLFLSLGARLVNDESPECRQMVGECLETLIGKMTKGVRSQLFDVVLSLLTDGKSSHREMAALLCTRFVVAEREAFGERLAKVLPPLMAALSTTGYKGPGQFVRVHHITAGNAEDENANSDEDDELDDEETKERRDALVLRAQDHQLFQVLNTMCNIYDTFATQLERDFPQYVDELAHEAQRLLAYEHVWVRLKAAKALDSVLSRLNVERVRRLMQNPDAEADENSDTDDDKWRQEFIYSNPREQLRALSLDLCAQLLPDVTDDEMAAQVTKNLLYVANLIKEVPLEKQTKEADDDDDEADAADKSVRLQKPINMVWLIKRMRYVVHAEVARAPHSTRLRTACFLWIESVADLLPAERVQQLARALLGPLVREMSEDDKNVDTKLRQLALKVGNAVRQKIGDEAYNLQRTQLQTGLMIKRAERRKQINQLKVLDPHRAALRKEGEKARKKVAHKRKLDVMKGRALPKKKRVKRTAEEDLF